MTMLAGMEAWGCRRQGGTSRGYRGRAWRLRGSEVAWAGSEAQAARRETRRGGLRVSYRGRLLWLWCTESGHAPGDAWRGTRSQAHAGRIRERELLQAPNARAGPGQLGRRPSRDDGQAACVRGVTHRGPARVGRACAGGGGRRAGWRERSRMLLAGARREGRRRGGGPPQLITPFEVRVGRARAPEGWGGRRSNLIWATKGLACRDGPAIRGSSIWRSRGRTRLMSTPCPESSKPFPPRPLLCSPSPPSRPPPVPSVDPPPPLEGDAPHPPPRHAADPRAGVRHAPEDSDQEAPQKKQKRRRQALSCTGTPNRTRCACPSADCLFYWSSVITFNHRSPCGAMA